MGRYLIEGGNTQNKGAQAMLFITVREIQKRDPGSVIYASSAFDVRRKTSVSGVEFVEESVQSKLYMNPKNNRSKIWLRNKLKKTLGKPYVKDLRATEKLLNKVDTVIDISGFTLASKWGDEHNIAYLDMIREAHNRGISVYLMPQSFGPFDYSGSNAAKIRKLIRENLPYATKIFAREQEGFDLIKEYAPNANVEKSVDLVLQSKEAPDANLIRSEIATYHIAERSVCIVPNQHSIDAHTGMTKAYYQAIDNLMKDGYTVYLLAHSTEDLKICRQIKSQYVNDQRVVVIEELNCAEYQHIVEKFRFIIASRYHSIVHAYKAGVPCVVVGWAVKYAELLKLFDQEAYLFQADSKFETVEFVEAVEKMSESYLYEKEKIRAILPSYQMHSCFEWIGRT